MGYDLTSGYRGNRFFCYQGSAWVLPFASVCYKFYFSFLRKDCSLCEFYAKVGIFS